MSALVERARADAFAKKTRPVERTEKRIERLSGSLGPMLAKDASIRGEKTSKTTAVGASR
jgi:hypothetical protein